MSISNDILVFLSSNPGSYKQLQNSWRKNLRGEVSNTTLYQTCYRLQKKGYIQKEKDNWIITKEGKGYINNKKLDHFHFKKTNTKNKILILFDIPEKERYKRDWLRTQLKNNHFKKIQASAWTGPGPLPKEFINYLKNHNIKKYIVLFKVKDHIEI